MNTEKISKIAETGANWWASQLSSESAKIDNGSTMTSGLASLMPKTKFPELVVNFFKENLKLIIEEQLKERGNITLGVDYHPDHFLSEAITKTEINVGMTDLPWKTTMWINLEEGVRVSSGYCASVEEITDEVITEEIPEDQCLSMEEVITNLQNLKSSHPGDEEGVYEFAKHLATLLNPKLVPSGFLLAVQCAVYDVDKEPEKFPFVKDLPLGILQRIAPQLAEKTCPKWFATLVSSQQQQILS